MKTKLFSSAIALALSPAWLLAADEGGPSPQQGMMQTVLMIGVAVLFFYLILWRPEQKRRKTLEEQRNKLKKGDRVIAMGIIGTVDKINQETVILKMVDGNKIEMVAAAITEITSATVNEEPTKTAEQP